MKLVQPINWSKRIQDRLSNGLQRTSLTCPSRWAEKRLYITPKKPGFHTPEPWSFEYFPWLRAPMDARADRVTTLKGAQLGFTTAGIGKVLFMLDAERKSILYLLPTARPDASEFSVTKLQSVIDDSDYIRGMFTDVSNVGLKKAGTATLFIRGANSRNALKSISVNMIVFDEYDEMPPENIPLAEERMSGQFETELWRLSTPTIPGVGVDADFQSTTKEHFYFPCPHGCMFETHARQIKLSPDDLVITANSLTDPDLKRSYIQTSCCKQPIDHETKRITLAKGDYIPEGHKDFSDRGFAVNQLYSSTMKPENIARLRIRADTNPAAEQEYWNSKMGIAHETKGSRLTDELIDAAIKPDLGWQRTEWTTMGIDVGTRMHVIIRNWRIDKLSADLNVYARSRLLLATSVKDTAALDALMHEYQVLMAVIDAQPERRLAVAFARRFPGHVRTCYYNTQGKSDSLKDHGDADYRMTVDRTFWLDTMFAGFKGKRTTMPDPPSDELRSHLKALVRVYRPAKDDEKEDTAYYRNTGPDHFAHAYNYSEMALPLAAAKVTNHDIEFFL